MATVVVVSALLFASVVRMMVKPSLRVLAEACGVSTATVSRALAGHPRCGRPCAGLDLRLELQGAVAAQAIMAQIQYW